MKLLHDNAAAHGANDGAKARPHVTELVSGVNSSYTMLAPVLGEGGVVRRALEALPDRNPRPQSQIRVVDPSQLVSDWIAAAPRRWTPAARDELPFCSVG